MIDLVKGLQIHVPDDSNMRVDCIDRPFARIHRWQDLDFDRCRVIEHVAFWLHVAGVMNHDWHDRHARLHRQVKRAFLERCEFWRYSPRSFWRQAHGLAFDAHRVDQWGHRLDSAGSVSAIDQHEAGCLHDTSDQRHIPDLALSHARNIAAQ